MSILKRFRFASTHPFASGKRGKIFAQRRKGAKKEKTATGEYMAVGTAWIDPPQADPQGIRAGASESKLIVMPKAIKSIGMDAMKFCHGKSRNGGTALREQSAVQSKLDRMAGLGKLPDKAEKRMS
jgi:hypothetical protein